MSEADEADFRAYVASRQRALRRTAFFMCGDWHAADDLIQTTLTKLYVAWHRVASSNGPDARQRVTVILRFWADASVARPRKLSAARQEP
jgi:hypothetical protein